MEIWEDHKATVENNRKAIIITLIINVMLLIGFYFIMVWKQPDPPMSQFGLELNLGFSDMGSDAKPTETPLLQVKKRPKRRRPRVSLLLNQQKI